MANEIDFATQFAQMQAQTQAKAEQLGNLGFDVPRVWCNAFNLSLSPGIAMLVAREGVNFGTAEQPGEAFVRNVGSWIMPEQALIELRDLLIRQFPLEPRDD